MILRASFGTRCCMCGLSVLVASEALQPQGLQPARLLCPWILWAGILEGVAMPSSRGPSRARDQTLVSYDISCIDRQILYL